MDAINSRGNLTGSTEGSGRNSTVTRGEKPVGISLVLPVFNEQECLRQAVREADIALAASTDDYEIIVVDDGSSDGTAKICHTLMQQFTALRVLRHETNIGYGAALRTGFDAAKKELVVFTDADCQFDLQELDRFVFLSRDYEIVCGYRIDRQDAWVRRAYSKIYNSIVRALLATGLRDVDCAFKLFRRSALQRLPATSNGFLINAELFSLAREHELSVVEVGVTHRPRIDGQSTVSSGQIPSVLTELLRFWWNRIVFSQNGFGTSGVYRHRLTKGHIASALLLLVPVLFLLFSNLSYPLIDRDETRYAEISREMLVTGNWVVPQLNFKPYYDKPPMLYWLCAISYKWFGVSEWSCRIVPASAGFVILVATYLFGRSVFGNRIGLISAAALLLSAGFVFCGRFLIIDMVLTAFVTFSLFSAYQAIRCGRIKWRWWCLSAFFCGLGVLAKGPVAVVLLLPPVVAFAWLSEIAGRFRRRHWLVMSGIITVVIAPWVVAVSLHSPEFLASFMIEHNLNRFAGAYHPEPFWYFVPVVLVGMHPWSCLLAPLGLFFASRDPSARLRRPICLGFLGLWVGWCLLFFSLSQCKLAAYVLPATPAFALLVGYYLDQVLFESTSIPVCQLAKSFAPWSMSIVTCASTVVLSVVAYSMQLVSITETISITIVCCAVAGALGIVWRRGTSTKIAWSVCVSIALLLLLLLTQHWVPSLGRHDCVFDPSSPLANSMRNPNQLVATYANEWSGVPFYLGRNDVRNFSRTELPELCHFVIENPTSIVILNNTLEREQLESHLIGRARLKRIEQSSMATIVVAEPIGLRYLQTANRRSADDESTSAD